MKQKLNKRTTGQQVEELAAADLEDIDEWTHKAEKKNKKKKNEKNKGAKAEEKKADAAAEKASTVPDQTVKP